MWANMFEDDEAISVLQVRDEGNLNQILKQ